MSEEKHKHVAGQIQPGTYGTKYLSASVRVHLNLTEAGIKRMEELKQKRREQ
jgi:hypothetical protein